MQQQQIRLTGQTIDDVFALLFSIEILQTLSIAYVAVCVRQRLLVRNYQIVNNKQILLSKCASCQIIV